MGAPSLPNPSTRLLRAAAAEQGDLRRHRERLSRKREALLAEVRHLDDALAVVDRRLSMLGALTELPETGSAPGDLIELAAPAQTTGAGPVHTTGATPSEPRVLRGPAIREVAVQALMAQREPVDALHYRRWYELIREAGYSIAGKDPLAVFLTQVSRSPVVRKATKPGVYELDHHAPLRIRQRLERLQSELRELAAAPDGPPVELAEIRARRHDLDVAISQQERALEEAIRVLRREGPPVPAAG